MANKFYERVNASTIKLWRRTEEYDKTDLQNEINDIDDLLALSNDEKEIAIEGSRVYHSVADFDEQLTTRKDKAQQIVDYWDHSTSSVSYDEIQDNWVSPIAVHSECGEEVGGEADEAIDGNLVNEWIHSVNERHWFILDMGATKRLSKVRIWLESDDGNQNKLEGVDVYMSDSPTGTWTQVASNLGFQTAGQWNEHTFADTRKDRYVKVGNIGTLHGNDNLRLHEIEFFSEVIF